MIKSIEEILQIIKYYKLEKLLFEVNNEIER